MILLNRSKNGKFGQEGIYASFSHELADPLSWSPPRRIPLPENKLAWYPQVIGLDKAKHETDKMAGRLARLFVRGESRWEILFLKEGEPN